jgi:pantothenate kinase
LYSVVLYARKIHECLIERNLILSISSIISKCDIRHSLLTNWYQSQFSRSRETCHGEEKEEKEEEKKKIRRKKRDVGKI